MDVKPSVKATANIAKNRLNLSISGNIDNKSLEKLYTEVRFCVADLKQGFEVVSDVSMCNMLHVTSFPTYKKIIDYLIANNVGEVVRIIRDGNISYKQILNFTEKIHTYKPIYAESKQEAEDKLALLIKRNGVRFKINTLNFQYNTVHGAGKGNVIDISTSGCAVEAPTIPLALDDEIQIAINFDEQKNLLSSLNIKGKVVRAAEQMFAAQFIDLADEQREQLYKRLAYEVSRSTFFL